MHALITWLSCTDHVTAEIFAIKTLNLPYDNYINNISNKYNSDLIIDLSLLDTIFEECSNSYNILQEILSYDIPITNIIALPQENCVIKDNIDFDTPIITTKDLSYYIKSKINKNAKYSPLNIKENLLENKTWIFDTLISNLQSFYSHTKLLIAFLFIFLLSYYIYITFVSYAQRALARSAPPLCRAFKARISASSSPRSCLSAFPP